MQANALRNSAPVRHGLVAAGVVVGLILMLVVRAWFSGSEITPPRAVGTTSEAPREVLQRHLVWADQQRAAVANGHLTQVREFFEVARQGRRAFATDALSWDSKWKLGQDYLTGSQEHAAFLQSRFDLRLFSRDDLDRLVNQVVASHLKHLDDVDAMMLVRLEQDLAVLPSSSFSQSVDRDRLHAVLNEALQQSLVAAQGEFRGMIGRELVSFVSGEVLAAAATHLATSAGILGTGAASGWVTFGTGIVVGLLVDAIVTEIYNQTFDPVGELSTKLDAQLTQLESLIVDGTPDSPGLSRCLLNYTHRRSAALRQSLEAAVLTNLSL